jgi:hypothetical protein
MTGIGVRWRSRIWGRPSIRRPPDIGRRPGVGRRSCVGRRTSIGRRTGVGWRPRLRGGSSVGRRPRIAGRPCARRRPFRVRGRRIGRAAARGKDDRPVLDVDLVDRWRSRIELKQLAGGRSWIATRRTIARSDDDVESALVDNFGAARKLGRTSAQRGTTRLRIASGAASCLRVWPRG